ncbi:MAG: serine/threonine-protein kinase [Ignavibacteriae bacterium]|nr:serine/threonine-protein kinase [Ignavibacteria bacterium]MBI3363322.1 serine/threonine-protein kinase [Ignavibacteriota bacterium]
MIGQTISHYKILEKLGEGGMGVVYKAEDTKLKRTVALKFLPPHLNASEQDKARFVQEAQAASALNHPNVCTIHDIQEHDGQMFIVMEFVDGQTLREKRGTINLGKAIEIGIQIADGLATAHEKGIVHRDIKPENIMVRKDGIVQIMDFGLAKLRASRASRLTKEGSTVGTAGYMSPEQVQGQDTDHRSDIFSLGVLLYELFTGELPFKGVHETALLYEIVNVDPAPMSTVKPEIDPELDRIVFECLQKEPDERYQAVKDISKDLKRFKRESSRQRASRITAARPVVKVLQSSEVVEPSGAPSKPIFWYLLSGVLAIAVLLLLLSPWRKDVSATRPVARFSIDLPPNAPLFGGASGLAVSPDGRYLTYTAQIPNTRQLYLHRMDQLTSEPIPGTEDCDDPAFSPDGQWIVFNAAQQKLVKVSIFGGAPEVICLTKGQTRGIWWAADNTIFYGHISSGIYRVSASGGTPEAATSLDSAAGEISHRFPQLLPDGKTIIFTIKQNNITTFDEAVIAAQRLATGERKILVRGGTYARYVPTGHLMYIRGNTIFAVPFDAERLEVKGHPVPIEEGGWMNGGSGQANIDFSNNGVLVFAPAGPRSYDNVALAWMDRHGATHPLLDTLRSYFSASLSPDGQKVATAINAANDDIWVYHIVRGVLTRLTFGGGNNDFPIWSPDGKYVVYGAEKGKSLNIFRKPWDGSEAEERLTNEVNAQVPKSFTPDGKVLSFEQNGDIWILPLDNERKPWPFIQSPANDGGGYFSPDGRWMAYTSNESGKNEVYVVAFPKREGKWQISNGGGAGAVWSRNGKELFYTNGSSLMVVDVSAGSTFDFSVPRKLCDIPPSTNLQDISPDGQRFLALVSQSQQLTLPRLEVVLEWFEEVKQKFAGNK